MSSNSRLLYWVVMMGVGRGVGVGVGIGGGEGVELSALFFLLFQPQP